MVGMRRAGRARIGAATLVGGLVLLGVPPAPAAVEDSPGTFSYLRSSDGGDTFSPLQLQDRDTTVGATHVVAEDGVVHAVYDSENEDEGPRQVRYRRSTDGGRSFADSMQLDVIDDRGSPSDGDSSESDLDVEGDNVLVVWEDDKLRDDGTVDPCCHPENPDDNPADENRDDIFWSASSDAGRSFSVPVNLTRSDPVHNRDPDVAIAGRRVALVYEGDDVIGHVATDEDDVLLRVSTDGGDSWDDERNLTLDAGGAQAEPAVDSTSDAIHVLYRDRQQVRGPTDQETGDGTGGAEPDAGDETPLEITHVGYVRLDGDGRHPTPPVLLPGPQAEHAAVLVQGDTVHVVACAVPSSDDPLEKVDLLYYRGTDTGEATTFPAPVVLASAPGCNKPAIDAAGRDVHIVVRAEDATGDHEIFHLRSDDGGKRFRNARNVSNSPMASEDPSVSVDRNGDLHLAWNDETIFLFGIRSGQVLPEEDGVRRVFWNEDVVQYTGQAYRMVIDGSDIGLRDVIIDGLARLSPTEYILSFTDPGEVPGAGWVDDSDLVLFTAETLGRATRGTLSRWFEGADIGLTGDEEDIDAVEVVQNRDPDTGEVSSIDLYLSTTGHSETTSGTAAGDEDILVCRGATTGADSSCTTTAVAFTGSDAGLSGGDEGIDAFSFDGIGPGRDDEQFASYYSTAGNFAVSGVNGASSDAIECVHPEAVPAASDPLSNCGRSEEEPLVKVFDGRSNLLVENLTALEFPYKA